MIFLIFYECFLCVPNLKSLQFLPILGCMLKISLTLTFNLFSVIMDVSSTIMSFSHILVLMESLFVSLVHTRRNRTVKPNAPFAPSTISSALFYFKHLYHLSFGLRLFLQPHIPSPYYPLPFCPSKLLLKFYLVLFHRMIIYVSLGVCATQTPSLQPLISCLHDQPLVSILVPPPIIKVTNAWTSSHNV